MLALGPISFAVPWALAALVLLPAIWWLLRITPPAPWRVLFPPMRLLLGLIQREETATRSPPWLMVLRLALVSAVILAAAHPLLNAARWLRGAGPVILVIDDGWAAAARWPDRRAMAEALIDQAGRNQRPVMVVSTAPGAAQNLKMRSAAEARDLVGSLQPKPWPTDRRAALAALSGDGAARFGEGQPGHLIWLSDGLEEGGTAALVRDLKTIGAMTVVGPEPERLPLVLRLPVAEGEALRITAVRATGRGPATHWVQALAGDGRLLARQALLFPASERRAETRLVLPAELRNRLSRLEIEAENTSAAVILVDERWRRRPVGLVDREGIAGGQPLLSALYYLERSLEPFTEIRRGGVEDLLKRQLAVLALADPGRLETDELRSLEAWIDGGGVLLRFAGPGLVQDPLLPVKLRQGDRIMGGTMSWSRPAAMAPFPASSPFHRLEIPADVKIRRQVLAQPSLDLADKTWARLRDGTPLVTAEKRGKGWLVLVHTSADMAWSNLPISGLFVDMLRRIVALAQGVAVEADLPPLPPLEVLDGFGRLGSPPASALAIAGDAFDDAVVAPQHPPGYYGDVASRRALNLSAGLADPTPFASLPAGVSAAGYGRQPELDLRPWLFGLALLLALVDLVASMAMRGLLRPAGIVAAAAIAAAGAHAADDEFAMDASLETRLAYMITGDQQVDELSRLGLKGLGVIVRRRTAAELGEPIGIDPATDELAFFPLLYWPVTSGPGPSPKAAAKLNVYLRDGGTILFDTRDPSAGMGPLRNLIRDLNIPFLSPVSVDHVLTRSFYLLDAFPGRWTGGVVWLERPGERVNDGVSSVIVGTHDWAGAWAMDDAQRPLHAVVPGGERQREMAFRFGINLVMYVLTGNYKADQVHLPAILERLGK